VCYLHTPRSSDPYLAFEDNYDHIADRPADAERIVY
jgi:hypothetical protein